jgi:4-diphosphocytidyl-2-C-methyl-D-erythritol kinase
LAQQSDRPMYFGSPGKVNLFLRVGGVRPDGLHPLVSWFCLVGLEDEILITADDSNAVTMSCDQVDIPCDGRNLVIRAGDLIRPKARRFRGVHIHLKKGIPAGGGLGGGSSNAATALRALSRLWDCAVSERELWIAACALGSDVPFFLSASSAICRGRGEDVTPVDAPAAKGILLLFPDLEMPTPAVYKKFDELSLGTDLNALEDSPAHGALPALELLPLLVNDLEAAAFSISPSLSALRNKAEQKLSRPVRMSGSGSTLFTIYDTLSEADCAAEEVRGTVRRAAAYRLGPAE